MSLRHGVTCHTPARKEIFPYKISCHNDTTSHPLKSTNIMMDVMRGLGRGASHDMQHAFGQNADTRPIYNHNNPSPYVCVFPSPSRRQSSPSTVIHRTIIFTLLLPRKGKLSMNPPRSWSFTDSVDKALLLLVAAHGNPSSSQVFVWDRIAATLASNELQGHIGVTRGHCM